MTSNFDSPNFEHQPPADPIQPSRSPDVVQRDRFELLSAYMDGEASADERRQVEDWLANDPTVQRLHTRLLKLRTSFQSMPVPISDEQAVQKTVDAVLSRVDRRPRLSLIWGGIAFAAVAIGALTSTLLGENSPIPQIARSGSDTETVQPGSDSEPLLVALDKPLVSIPKTPVAPSESVQSIPTESTDNIR